MAYDPNEYNEIDPFTGKRSKLVQGPFGTRTWVHDPGPGTSAPSGGGAGPSMNYAGAAAQANTDMRGWLGQAGPQRAANPFSAPTMNQSNRFEAGLAANERRLNALLEDPNAIQQTAAYKFRLGQGQEALQRSLGAKGLLGSGNRLTELTKYGQDMASQEYDAQANRLSNLVNQYSGHWLGDKNANTAQFNALSNAYLGGENALTSRYAAESQAHLGRGNILADLLKSASGNATAWDIAQQKQAAAAASPSGGRYTVTGGFRTIIPG